MSADPITLPREAATFDLSLSYRQRFRPDGEPGGVQVTLGYARDLFDHRTVHALAARFARLLRAAAAHPDHPVTALEILAPSERDQILARWNDISRVAPQATLPDLIQQQAAANPAAPAVVDGHTTMSYATLNARANQLARHLMSLGAGPERLVAVAMDRSAELVVALLAVLKSGAAYLPVDPGYPADRVEFMLAEASPVAVLTTGAVEPRLAGARRVLLDDPAAAAELGRLPEGDVTATERARVMRADSPAYVIYTSGSTGRPKGVIVTHAGVVNFVARMHAEFDYTTADRFLHKASISFDASAWELFTPLTMGAAVVIAHTDGQRDPAYLAS